MPYWDDGSGQSKSQYDSSGGYDNTGNQNNNPTQTIAQKAPPKKPKVTKDNKVSEGFIKNYFNITILHKVASLRNSREHYTKKKTKIFRKFKRRRH